MQQQTVDRSESAAAQKPVRRRRGCAGIFFVLMILASAIWGAALGGVVWILEDSKNTIAVLDTFRPKEGSKIYSDDAELLGEFVGAEIRELVNLNEIPLHLQKAFLATEDHLFFEHRGVRPDALANVLYTYLRTGNLRGASTITMQTVRNVDPTGISKERTMKRKLAEMRVALQLEREFTKDEILELYLNSIFLGVSAYGVEAASQQYFAKSCSELTLGESAMLAGLTRSPNANQPFAYPERALRLRNTVLWQMLENGYIVPEEYETARGEVLEDTLIRPEERAALKATGRQVWGPNSFNAPYAVEEVRRYVLGLTDEGTGQDTDALTEMEDLDDPVEPDAKPERDVAEIQRNKVFEEGLRIYTTIDMRFQRAAEEALFKALDEFDEKKRADLKRQHQEDQFVPVSGALVCLDNRPGYQGYIRALVGGRDFGKEKYNTVTQARLQPGSSIKPFVWAAAIDNNWTPADIVVDEPFARRDGAGRWWQPKNFSGDYKGPVTLRYALEQSINIVSVKLVERLGVPVVRSYLQGAGFRKPIYDSVGLTLGLGTPETTVLDQAVCYSTFVNGGLRYDPILVTEVKDRDGFTQLKNTVSTDPHRAFPRDVAYVMTYLLQGVCERGTGTRTKSLERPRAGKTGTTNDSRDAWFCGFTPQFTCVVWVGYRDHRSLGRGKNYTGGRLASPIWTEFMKVAHEGLPVLEFEAPEGVTKHAIDKSSGLAGGGFDEAFIRDTAPRQQAPVAERDEISAELDEEPIESLSPIAPLPEEPDAIEEPAQPEPPAQESQEQVEDQRTSKSRQPVSRTPKRPGRPFRRLFN